MSAEKVLLVKFPTAKCLQVEFRKDRERYCIYPFDGKYARLINGQEQHGPLGAGRSALEAWDDAAIRWCGFIPEPVSDLLDDVVCDGCVGLLDCEEPAATSSLFDEDGGLLS